MQAEPPKRKRRWLQFSLRSLLIFTAVAAVACGWFGARLRRAANERLAVDAIMKDGGSVAYDYQFGNSGGRNANPEASKKWTMSIRQWTPALNQFAIAY